MWRALLLFVFVVVSGCLQPAPEANPAELLKRATLQFHSDLRWQRFDQAAAHLPSDQREAFLSYYEERRKVLAITEFEVVKLELSPDQKSAHAQILLSWYELPSTHVSTSLVDERWVFYEQLSRWEVTEQTVSPTEDVPRGLP